MSAAELGWRSYHLYYHADRSLALTAYLRPTLGPLLLAATVDSFFFLRYWLGGPHLRIRLRLAPERAGEVEERLAAAAATFFARWPSTASRPADQIARENEAILADAPLENDAVVYPDNTFLVCPFRPEVARYGGPSLIEASFDFFALSSAMALRFLASHGGETAPRQLAAAGGILARLAWAFATSTEELASLLDYPRTFWPEPPAVLVEKGDASFNRQPAALASWLRSELHPLAPPEAGLPVDTTAAGWLLSAAIAGADAPTRRRILTSQMHTSANRLGLTNQDEIYLTRILVRALEALVASSSGEHEALEAQFAARAALAPRAGLRDLLRPAFAECFTEPGPEAAAACHENS